MKVLQETDNSLEEICSIYWVGVEQCSLSDFPPSVGFGLNFSTSRVPTISNGYQYFAEYSASGSQIDWRMKVGTTTRELLLDRGALSRHVGASARITPLKVTMYKLVFDILGVAR